MTAHTIYNHSLSKLSHGSSFGYGDVELNLGLKLVFAILCSLFLAMFAGGFDSYFKVLKHTGAWLEQILGGAPRNITLPGPQGLPLIGNLLQVSQSKKVCESED